jgi:hypothetical protein
MIFHCFAIFFVSLVVCNATRDIPNYIHICKRSDPHVARCIRESVEILKPRLKSGIPEINVPSLEPLRIDEIAIFRGEPPSNLKAFLRNIDVHGASDFQITKLKLNIDKNTYRLGVRFPKMTMVGDYDIDARLLVVPIKGSGKFTADITDIDGQGVLKAEIIQHTGHRQLNFTSFDFAIKIGDYNIHLDNLFNGDEVLSKAASEILHENKGELIQGALPFIQRKAAEILLEAARKITDDLDYDKVFPEK